MFVAITAQWAWALRAVWATLPVTFGLLLGDALADTSRPIQLTVVGGAWLLWAAGLVATLVFHPIGLVVLRPTAVLAVAAAGWATVHTRGGPSWSSASIALGAGAAIVAVIAAFSPETGHLAVNGPAYPNERRFLLRPAAVYLLGPIPLAAALLVGGLVTGPLLLAARQWIAGAMAVAVGVALVWATTRSLHAVARRFAVFVPAGFVVHDANALREPVLFLRAKVERFRVADESSDALDLTGGAAGLVVEVDLREKVEVTKVSGPRDRGETGGTARFLIVPTLPGRLLAEAAERRYATD